jgi:hypothetical protein
MTLLFFVHTFVYKLELVCEKQKRQVKLVSLNFNNLAGTADGIQPETAPAAKG